MRLPLGSPQEAVAQRGGPRQLARARHRQTIERYGNSRLPNCWAISCRLRPSMQRHVALRTGGDWSLPVLERETTPARVIHRHTSVRLIDFPRVGELKGRKYPAPPGPTGRPNHPPPFFSGTPPLSFRRSKPLAQPPTWQDKPINLPVPSHPIFWVPTPRSHPRLFQNFAPRKSAFIPKPEPIPYTCSPVRSPGDALGDGGARVRAGLGSQSSKKKAYLVARAASLLASR